MAYGGGQYVDITLPAAADLSAAQYRFLVVDSNGRGTISAANGLIVGILQDKPNAVDHPARIRIAGISKLVAGAALTAGSVVMSNAQGFGTMTPVATTGMFVGGHVLVSSAASADVADILINKFIV